MSGKTFSNYKKLALMAAIHMMCEHKRNIKVRLTLSIPILFILTGNKKKTVRSNYCMALNLMV